MNLRKLSSLASLLALVVAGVSLYQSYRIQAETRMHLDRASQSLDRFEKSHEIQQTNLDGVKAQVQETREGLVDLERELAAVRGAERDDIRKQVQISIAEARQERGGEGERQRRGERAERVKPKPGRPFLGVQLLPVSPEAALRLKFPGEAGALISRVVKGSPAERAGLRADDIIVKVNDRNTENVEHFLDQMQERQPDETVALQIFRDGKSQDFRIPLGHFGAED